MSLCSCLIYFQQYWILLLLLIFWFPELSHSYFSVRNMVDLPAQIWQASYWFFRFHHSSLVSSRSGRSSSSSKVLQNPGWLGDIFPLFLQFAFQIWAHTLTNAVFRALCTLYTRSPLLDCELLGGNTFLFSNSVVTVPRPMPFTKLFSTLIVESIESCSSFNSLLKLLGNYLSKMQLPFLYLYSIWESKSCPYQ